MAYYDSMHDLIGNTPIVKLSHLDLPEGVELFAKLELANPGGSIKDRVGVALLRAAEERGELHPGSTIVLGTAGNTGIGIAFAALGRGYRVIFTVPEKFSQEKAVLMAALGAEIVRTPREAGMLGANQKAAELAQEIPGAVMLNQFSDPANPQVHYETTGPEIWRDMAGKIDYFVCGAGSGGTYTGIVRYLKEQNPQIVGVLADPYGSTIGGGEHGSYDIEGIGNDFIPETMDMSLVDKVIKVHDNEARDMVRTLARTEGIIAGSSSGAAVAAAQKLAATGVHGRIVVVLPDRGDRYFSKHLLEPTAQEV